MLPSSQHSGRDGSQKLDKIVRLHRYIVLHRLNASMIKQKKSTVRRCSNGESIAMKPGFRTSEMWGKVFLLCLLSIAFYSFAF